MALSLYSTISFAEYVPLPAVPPTIVLEETGDVLTLRGVGLHKVFFEDSYLGAFYSLVPLKGASEALSDSGPKRMVFYFLRPINNFQEILGMAIAVNNSPELSQREQINISQFLDYVNLPLQKGDTIVLDYVPNVGTKVVVKGSLRGVIKGNEFYNLVLKVWMGRQPPSNKFRKDLFNLS
jgi:hypothetical protein